jgi:hypothetical protein
VSESARAKALRLVVALFGFVVTLLTNRELVDAVCERLLEMYSVEPRPATESDEYYKLCIELVLKNRDASDFFYCLALLYIIP